MKNSLKDLALLISGVALLGGCLRLVVSLVTGSTPALSGATIGAVLLLVAGLGLCLASLLRMGLVEVVEEKDGRTGIALARARSTSNPVT